MLPSHLEKKDLESTMAVQWINLLVKKNIIMFLSAKQFLSQKKNSFRTIENQARKAHYSRVINRVSDPYSFDTDPDPAF